MESIDIVEIELTVLDQLYYVSRESGDDFGTRPYIMHTALYYALGLLPSRFRVSEQSPKYTTHFENSQAANGLYIHPATPVGDVAGQYTTRRFAVKGDEFRQQSEQENKNLKETGFQRFLNAGTTLRAFARVDNGDASRLADRFEGYCRLGKKMTSTRVRTVHHTVTPETGEFDLGHPISNVDIGTQNYRMLGNIHLEPMMPVNLITQAHLSGEFVSLTPAFGSETGSIALPTETEFLQQHR